MVAEFPQAAFRQTLGWLLLTQQMMVVHLIGILPDWALAIANLALAWRLAIFLGKVPPPRPWVLFLISLMVLLSLVPLYLGEGLAITLSVMIALAYSLKSLEVRSRRDILVLTLVGFFLISLSLIPQQSPLKLASALALFTLNITVLLSLHSSSSARSNLGTTLRLALFSLPMTLLLYLLVPRVDPLWHQGVRPGAQTGLSDTLSLGEIAELTQSTEMAFNASFELRPPQELLYFRVWIHNLYDGRTWHGARPYPLDAITATRAEEGHLYRISHWYSGVRLPTLAMSQGLSPGMRPLGDGLWQGRIQQDQVLSWRPRAIPAAPAAITEALMLPASGNPRARQLGESLKGLSQREIVHRVLRRFRDNPFHYTLSPPATGPNEIDDFLFDTQAGFCGHYAGAMVFVLRAAGIPARLVTGYQGGRWLGDSNRLQVRQLNAHAWVEYWLPAQGWIRTDPTNMVAPDRVQILGEQRLAQWWGLSGWLKESAPVRTLGAWADSLNALWHQQVSGFDRLSQQQWLSQWLGKLSVQNLMLLAAAIVLTTLLIHLKLARMLTPPRLPAPELLLWRWLSKRLSRLGAQPGPATSVSQLVAMTRHHCPPASLPVRLLQRLFYRLRYADLPPGKRRLLRLAMWRQFLKLRRALKAEVGSGSAMEIR
ncbi:DUF3488 and transglutaminase-like domain-containing protein [Ferrimonas sp. YFM]|uniref:transglutaminase family protein n=1 Tax=Ferrimonas sp. YFM TaxID=3028878 RepID=UPI002573E4F8|nr:DUF3488 and transglutaminase-like domain-containing protein [Ferrimonas sp. YFM]BDY04222.1 protein-glutamine gamma-glutamyltransferase [Ferrimonas sp. YFM]